jgi:hypothetical protein
VETLPHLFCFEGLLARVNDDLGDGTFLVLLKGEGDVVVRRKEKLAVRFG